MHALRALDKGKGRGKGDASHTSRPEGPSQQGQIKALKEKGVQRGGARNGWVVPGLFDTGRSRRKGRNKRRTKPVCRTGRNPERVGAQQAQQVDVSAQQMRGKGQGVHKTCV